MKLKLPRPAARQRALVDCATAAYVQWQLECAAVRETYQRWVGASAAEEPIAFAVYNAALDHEEDAASRYAQLMRRAGRLPETGLAHQLAQIQMSSRRRS